MLLGLDAAEVLQPWLLTRYWLSYVDLFRDPILWGDVVRGVLLQLGYLVVFTSAACANFGTTSRPDPGSSAAVDTVGGRRRHRTGPGVFPL